MKMVAQNHTQSESRIINRVREHRRRLVAITVVREQEAGWEYGAREYGARGLERDV